MKKLKKIGQINLPAQLEKGKVPSIRIGKDGAVYLAEQPVTEVIYVISNVQLVPKDHDRLEAKIIEELQNNAEAGYGVISSIKTDKEAGRHSTIQLGRLTVEFETSREEIYISTEMEYKSILEAIYSTIEKVVHLN